MVLGVPVGDSVAAVAGNKEGLKLFDRCSLLLPWGALPAGSTLQASGCRHLRLGKSALELIKKDLPCTWGPEPLESACHWPLLRIRTPLSSRPVRVVPLKPNPPPSLPVVRATRRALLDSRVQRDKTRGKRNADHCPFLLGLTSPLLIFQTLVYIGHLSPATAPNYYILFVPARYLFQVVCRTLFEAASCRFLPLLLLFLTRHIPLSTLFAFYTRSIQKEKVRNRPSLETFPESGI